MELLLELSQTAHRIARLDKNGNKNYFLDRSLGDNNDTFSDVVFLADDLILTGQIGLLYAQKMDSEAYLIYPIRQYAAAKIENNQLKTADISIVKALVILLKNLKYEAEVQFGCRAKNINIQFLNLNLSKEKMSFFQLILAWADFPFQRILVGDKEVRKKSNLKKRHSIGWRYGSDNKIRWVIKHSDSERITETEITSESFNKIQFFIKTNEDNSTKEMGELNWNGKLEKAELEIHYHQDKMFDVQLINWKSGEILKTKFDLLSPKERQLFDCLHSKMSNKL